MTATRPAPNLPLALILTVLLTAWWTALAWGNLGALRLPEPDDMLRLAQIRDWVDGQGFADLTQARLGPPGGTAMPWSRLPDLVPALVIRLLSPMMGETRAEIAAVIFWPELLFFLHLLLTGALAKRLGGPATIPAALALGALAFPALAVFMPGRIDDHGLQVVLVEAMALGLLGKRMFLAGAGAGAGLLIGTDVAPAIVAAMGWLGGMWVREQRPGPGFGLGLLATALAGVALLRPEVWPADRCDGFTPPLFASTLVASGGWLVLGGLSPRLPDLKWRAVAAIAIAVLALATIWLVAPICLATGEPPAAAHAGLWRQSWGSAIALLGLPLIGFGAALALSRRGPRRADWALCAAIIGISIGVCLVRTSGAWFAAALAPPVLAEWANRLRARGIGWRIGAWLVSAGLVWQTLGNALEARPDPRAASCTSRETLSGLGRLEPGTFAAPMDLSAYLVGGTQHRSLTGHASRNVGGNRAAAQLFAASPEVALYQARLWTVDYIALCPTASGGLPPALRHADGLAAHLLNGAAPDWLEPVELIGSDLLVWRVRAIASPLPHP